MINSLITEIEAELTRQGHTSILTDRDKIILDAVNKRFQRLEQLIYQGRSLTNSRGVSGDTAV